MPQIPYTVKLPDGSTVQFKGPDSMSDQEVYTRALQERKFQTGEITTSPTTAAARTLASDPTMTHDLPEAAIAGAGAIAGQPEVVAAAPAAADTFNRWIRQKFGQPVEPLTTRSLIEAGVKDAVKGAAMAYGPALIESGANNLAANIARVRPKGVTGAVVKSATETLAPGVAKVAGAMTPESIASTVGEVGDAAATGARAAAAGTVRAAATASARLKGASSGDLDLMRGMVEKGWAPGTAARIISNGNKDAGKILLDWWAKVK